MHVMRPSSYCDRRNGLTMKIRFLAVMLLATQVQAAPSYKALVATSLGIAVQALPALVEAVYTCNGPYVGTLNGGEALLNCTTSDLITVTAPSGSSSLAYCAAYAISVVNNTVSMYCSQYGSAPGLSCFTPQLVAYKVTKQEGKQNYNKVDLANLQVGDTVLDANGNPTLVTGFLHKVVDTPTQALRFYGERDSQEIVLLEATPTHLIFDSGNVARYAADFKVGDAFLGAKEKPVKITRIEAFTTPELIAPLTQAGTLRVGAGSTSVGASCYAHVPSHRCAHAYYQTKRWVCSKIGINPEPNGQVSGSEGFVLRCMQAIGAAK